MTNKRNLSYTGMGMFHECPKKYDYHYNHKLRPIKEPAYFGFGRAVDVACNEILLGTKEGKAAAYAELDKLKTDNIIFDARDFDVELFDAKKYQDTLARVQKIGYKGDDLEGLVTALLREEDLTENQQLALAEACVESMKLKVDIIMKSFKDNIMPMVEEVEAVQLATKRGIIDFKAKLKGYGTVYVDNKTSSRPYEKDAVKWSTQLIGYGAERAMYIVFPKTMKKTRVKTCSKCGHDGSEGRHKTCNNTVDGVRCEGEWEIKTRASVEPQILVDDIPEESRALVESAYVETEAAIETGVFPKNLKSCRQTFGYKVFECPYLHKCWHNSDYGLKKVGGSNVKN